MINRLSNQLLESTEATQPTVRNKSLWLESPGCRLFTTLVWIFSDGWNSQGPGEGRGGSPWRILAEGKSSSRAQGCERSGVCRGRTSGLVAGVGPHAIAHVDTGVLRRNRATLTEESR